MRDGTKSQKASHISKFVNDQGQEKAQDYTLIDISFSFFSPVHITVNVGRNKTCCGKRLQTRQRWFPLDFAKCFRTVMK